MLGLPLSYTNCASWASNAAAIFDFEETPVDLKWRLEPAEAELRRALAGMGWRGWPG